MKVRISFKDPNLTLLPKNPSKQRIADDIKLRPTLVTLGLILRSYRIETYNPITLSSQSSLIFAVLL